MKLQEIKQRFGIIGNSPGLNRALEVALRVAPTDLSVLISGESGVGKEFFPQILHAYSARKHGNYIAVNCGAIPEGTIDSELFGHEKGAFTGASDSRKGYFEVADNGTIFLDEVSELPPQTQVRLLRVLQSGEFIRVGSSKAQKTNVRVVAATNMDLLKAIERGLFREDLYYRLNTVPISVPPLRERKGDIPLLFRKFASDIAAQYRMPVVTLTPEAEKILENYSWPGNVRQLKNVAEQISAVEKKREIEPDVLSTYLPNYTTALPMLHPSRTSDGEPMSASERDLLYKIMFDLRGEVSELKGMVAELRGERMGMPAAGAQPLSEAPYGNVIRVAEGAGHNPTDSDYIDATEEPDEPARPTKEQVQRDAIVKALRKHHGRRKEAAAELFISERTLYRRMRDLGIDDEAIK